MTDDLAPARLERFALRYARVALGAAFLSAVAGRLGLVGHGDFAGFERYTAEVLAFAPPATIPLFARAATVLELGFGVALLAGVWPRWIALGSASLLALFALAMAISLGVREPLSYSVFSASACALIVAARAQRR